MALGASHRLQDGDRCRRNHDAFRAGRAGAGIRRLHLSRRPLASSTARRPPCSSRRVIYSASSRSPSTPSGPIWRGSIRTCTGAAARTAMLGIMALGCAMIIAMSSWLNAAALAGSAALEQHLAETVEDYTADLDQGAPECACRAKPAAGYPARLRALPAPVGPGARKRRADRHDRLRQRRAAARPDVGADEGARNRHHSLARDASPRSSTKAAPISPPCARWSRRRARSSRAPSSSRPKPWR